jgi:hypothetical protein
MNTVVEQYIEFSWASQEQNGKMKITLTWTNVNYSFCKYDLQKVNIIPYCH